MARDAIQLVPTLRKATAPGERGTLKPNRIGRTGRKLKEVRTRAVASTAQPHDVGPGGQCGAGDPQVGTPGQMGVLGPRVFQRRDDPEVIAPGSVAQLAADRLVGRTPGPCWSSQREDSSHGTQSSVEPHPWSDSSPGRARPACRDQPGVPKSHPIRRHGNNTKVDTRRIGFRDRVRPRSVLCRRSRRHSRRSSERRAHRLEYALQPDLGSSGKYG